MKKLILITLSFCFSSSVLFSQITSNEEFKKNSLYLELGGNSLLYSFTFDNLVRVSDNTKLALGAGFEYVTSYTVNDNELGATFCVIPSANLLFGKNSHHLETGLACFAGIGKGGLIPSARIGYRFQPNNGGLVFRIGYTPMLIDGISHYAGLSVGYSF